MSNVQAAIGLGQLERIEELVEAECRIFGWYAEGLQGVNHLRLNREDREDTAAFSLDDEYLSGRKLSIEL